MALLFVTVGFIIGMVMGLAYLKYRDKRRHKI